MLLTSGWVAATAQEVPTEPALVPIVTTAAEFAPVEVAKVYIRRWPAQENVIRDWLLPLGLDTNHGYSKAPVRNSEVEKKRAALEKWLGNARRWGEKARLASLRAHKTSDRRWKRAKGHSRELYSELNGRLSELDSQGVSEREYRTRKRELVDAVEAEMEGYWRGYLPLGRHLQQGIRQVGALPPEAAGDPARAGGPEGGREADVRADHRKDQLMTALKLALANLALWRVTTTSRPSTLIPHGGGSSRSSGCLGE